MLVKVQSWPEATTILQPSGHRELFRNCRVEESKRKLTQCVIRGWFVLLNGDAGTSNIPHKSSDFAPVLNTVAVEQQDNISYSYGRVSGTDVRG